MSQPAAADSSNKRQEKALKDDMEVISVNYWVRSKGSCYIVTAPSTGKATCTCSDNCYRQVDCKHIIHCNQIANSQRLECPYGDQCTRKNLFHLQEYTHKKNNNN